MMSSKKAGTSPVPGNIQEQAEQQLLTLLRQMLELAATQHELFVALFAHLSRPVRTPLGSCQVRNSPEAD